MGKLHYIMATAVSILSLNSINSNTRAANHKLKPVSPPPSQNKLVELSPEKKILIAQTPPSEQNSGTDDEMIDALQKRQEKIKNLQELQKLNQKINSDRHNQEMLDALQEQNLDIESVEELQTIQQIVNEDLTNEEMLDALREQNLNNEALSPALTGRGLSICSTMLMELPTTSKASPSF
ncbi:hypothetical protein IQ255_26575 [Pleurocapsales cyanobacterium LEGE 10410]|nr:hypothetical protein [Pleurocapsales cyanobacterium LEGE 10410]